MIPFRTAFASAEFRRFLAAGAIGFAVDSGCLLVLVHGLGMAPLFARAGSFAIALITTWLINRMWTFRANLLKGQANPAGTEFLSYSAVQITGGTANFVVYAAMVAMLGREPFLLLVALAAGSATGLLINYLGARKFVFARADEPRA